MRAPSKYTNGLGERIRYVRKQSGMSQGELGDMLHLSRQSISGYETERLYPSTRVLENICEQYNVPPWWLLYGVGSQFAESSGASPSETPAYLSSKSKQLTHAQLSLIEYIREDKDAAQQLARMLWNKALKG